MSIFVIIIFLCFFGILCAVIVPPLLKHEKHMQKEKEWEELKENAKHFIQTNFPSITNEKLRNNLIYIKALGLDPENFLISLKHKSTQIALSPICFNDEGIQLCLSRRIKDHYIKQYYGTLYWSEILSIITVNDCKETYKYITIQTFTHSYQLKISTEAAQILINIWEQYYKKLVSNSSITGYWNVSQFYKDRTLIDNL